MQNPVLPTVYYFLINKYLANTVILVKHKCLINIWLSISRNPLTSSNPIKMSSFLINFLSISWTHNRSEIPLIFIIMHFLLLWAHAKPTAKIYSQPSNQRFGRQLHQPTPQSISHATLLGW